LRDHPSELRALLDGLTHHVHILEVNGDSYRLKQSKSRRRKLPGEKTLATEIVDPEPAKSQHSRL
jgi:hypothetical protein